MYKLPQPWTSGVNDQEDQSHRSQSRKGKVHFCREKTLYSFKAASKAVNNDHVMILVQYDKIVTCIYDNKVSVRSKKVRPQQHPEISHLHSPPTVGTEPRSNQRHCQKEN